MAPVTEVRPTRSGNGEEREQQRTALASKPDVAMTASGFMPKDIDQAWRYATALAASQFVPQTYSGKPGDCLIAIDISMRLGVHPLAFLQNSYVVHGKPGMEAKLIITLINKSGLFTDPLEYEVEGEDPADKNYRVRAFAKRKSTGKVLYGPWITWKIVAAEGWDKKPGSKWLTMPALMFVYRAASWFANLHCPEIKMGLDSVDELQDMGDRKQVESRTLEPTNGRKPFGFTQPAETPAEEQPPIQEDKPADPTAQSPKDSPTTTEAPATTTATKVSEGDRPGTEPPEPGVYTCLACGWSGDKTARGGKCPKCKAPEDKVVATADLEEKGMDLSDVRPEEVAKATTPKHGRCTKDGCKANGQTVLYGDGTCIVCCENLEPVTP